jgi:protoporphyrinogen oxidase
MNNQRVAIIGGGIAGLVAANELARLAPHFDISLYERSKSLGGRASTVKKDAFYLNQGAHALYNAGTLNKYLQKLGISLAGSPPAQANSLAYIDGSFKPLPGGWMSLASTSLLNPIEKLALAWFLAELPRIDTKALMSIPFSEWLDDRFGKSNVVKLLKALTRLGTYSNGPDLLSTGAALEQLKLAQAGVRYLDYGWQNIVSALRNALPGPISEHLDQEVSSVREVMTDHGPRVAVTAGGGVEIFDFVILAVPPAVAEKLAGDAFPKNLTEKLVTAKIACLDICLRKLPNPSNTFALGMDDALYYSVHGVAAKLADDDSIVIHMGVYLEPGEHGGERHLAMMTEMLDKLQPGWQDQLVYKRFLPNMVASYAQPLATRGGRSELETPALPNSERMFVIGDWVGQGHFLVDASAASALEAAKLISQKQQKPSIKVIAACA